MSPDPSTPAPLPAAAVARRLGIAPATLRTWDRRYGVGPSQHQAGAHRRYTADDLARLEAIQELVQQGVTVADAAHQLRSQPPPRRRRARAPEPTIAPAAPSRPVTPRQVREAALRLDADRLVTLLHRAVGELGVVGAWDTVVRPAMVWLGERWQSSDGCIAAEHVLSDCASAVFTSLARMSPATSTRPVLLVCAPGDEHVLPLHALAAALTERRVRNCVIGPSTPVTVTAEAIRRLSPSAVLVWSQLEQTADPASITGRPAIRAGHRVAAAGPGWDHIQLPARVSNPQSITEALAFLASAGSHQP
jgi:DNA-binding transcriptional MerR regulator